MSQEFGLHRVGSNDLKRLFRALHQDVLSSPITRSSLIEKAFGDIEGHLDLLIGRDTASAKAILLAVMAERSGDRGQVAALSYCGAPSPGTRSRDLADQVRELIASATQSVHLYGITIGEDPSLLRTIGALMGGRDVRVRLAFDIAPQTPLAHVRAYVDEALSTRGQLEVFACPRLHARVAIVDDSKVLVTSGALSAVEEAGAIDVGVLIRDHTYVEAWSSEWQRLVAGGVALAVPE
jgi:phosphatidylserine/phosphatidylglycerophosphate/cardiolipin synthase-like enzyme